MWLLYVHVFDAKGARPCVPVHLHACQTDLITEAGQHVKTLIRERSVVAGQAQDVGAHCCLGLVRQQAPSTECLCLQYEA
jgi:hypothetical protein